MLFQTPMGACSTQRIKMPGVGIGAANLMGRQEGTQLAGCLCAGLRQSFHRWFPRRQPRPHGESRLGSNSALLKLERCKILCRPSPGPSPLTFMASYFASLKSGRRNNSLEIESKIKHASLNVICYMNCYKPMVWSISFFNFQNLIIPFNRVLLYIKMIQCF